MVNCAVVGCGKNTNKHRGRSFFRIPAIIQNQCKKTLELSSRRRKEWIARIKREDLKETNIKPHTKVCDLHFIAGKPSYLFDENNPDWSPSLLLGYTTVKSRPAAAQSAVERFNRTWKRKSSFPLKGPHSRCSFAGGRGVMRDPPGFSFISVGEDSACDVESNRPDISLAVETGSSLATELNVSPTRNVGPVHSHDVTVDPLDISTAVKTEASFRPTKEYGGMSFASWQDVAYDSVRDPLDIFSIVNTELSFDSTVQHGDLKLNSYPVESVLQDGARNVKCHIFPIVKTEPSFHPALEQSSPSVFYPVHLLEPCDMGPDVRSVENLEREASPRVKLEPTNTDADADSSVYSPSGRGHESMHMFHESKT